MARPRCFLDMTIDGAPAGRIVVELYADVVPKTVENFRALCTGEKGEKHHYKSCVLHRVIPGFMMQAGDFARNYGTVNHSIYGGKFEDETFEGLAGKHTGRGCLSMANSGPNSNGSQFFICFGDTAWLDGKHIVFGQVVEGLEVLDVVERCGTSSGKTNQVVAISDSGAL